MPSLTELGPTLYMTKLNYRVAFGKQENPFQMKDLHVELSGNLRTPKAYSTGIHEAAQASSTKEASKRFNSKTEVGKSHGWARVLMGT